MNNRHEFTLDLARARERELIAAAERARRDGRLSHAAEDGAGATRSVPTTRGARALRRVRLIVLTLRRARLAAVREQGPC